MGTLNYRFDGGRVFVSLKPGESVLESLQQIAVSENLPSGSVTGIGALTDVVLGYYDMDSHEYQKKSFPGFFELINLTGNISMKEKTVFVHAHVTLGKADFSVIGGHLFDGRISAAGEFIITPGSLTISRELNPVVGLPLWKLENRNA